MINRFPCKKQGTLVSGNAMKKVLFILFLSVCFVPDFFAATKLRLGFSTNSSTPRAVASASFKNEVEEKSKGRILVELYDSTKLSSIGLKGSDTDLIESIIKKGPVNMTVSSAGNFALYEPQMAISALPYLFNSFEGACNFLETRFVKNIDKKMEDLNIVVLAYFTNGFRCITTTDKKIESLKDLKNLHIRAPANKPVIETLTALGCDVEPADFNKVFEGLQSGRFEAQENPIPAISCHKLNLVQKYLAVTNHSFDAMPLVIRKDMWNSLSAEDRQIIQEAANNAEKLDHTIVKAQTLLLITDFKKQGMTITYPDLEEFKKACSCIYEQYNQAFGESFMSLALKLAQQ